MRKTNYIVAFALILTTLFSCSKEEVGFGDRYNGEKIDMTIDLEKSDELILQANEQTVNLRVAANYWWKLETQMVHQDGEYEATDWLTIESNHESFGNQPITFSTTRNIEQRERTYKLIFISQDKNEVQREVILRQKPAIPFIETDVNEKTFSLLASTFDIILSASEEWEISEKPSWINIVKTSGAITRDETIGIEVLFNGTDIDREGKVIFSSKGTSGVFAEINVKQGGRFDPPTITVTNNEAFNVSFNTTPGALYYMLNVYRQGETSVLTGVRIESSNDAQLTYDLSTIDYKGYAGNVDISVSSFLSDSYSKTSTIATTNNYFDPTSGDGSESSPFIVSNKRHFNNIAKAPTKYFTQTADIDLAGTAPTLIGTSASPFTGNYNGNGKKVSNIVLASTTNAEPLALFRYVDGGTVRNLTIDKAMFTLTHIAPSDAASALFIGRLSHSGILENCHSTDCQIKITTANVLTGGLVGYNDKGTITHCSTSGGEINSNKGTVIGGIVGMNGNDSEPTPSVVEYCTNNMPIVTSANNCDIGGIAGYNQHTIKNSVNRANLKGYRFVGGIMSTSKTTNAAANNVHVYRCANYGNISFMHNATTSTCGGIAGRYISGANTGGARIEECYNAGNISLDGVSVGANVLVGGISGRCNNAQINNCYNVGAIINNTASTGPICGGISGDANGAISHSYSIGSISGATPAKAGGITGAVTAGYAITDCFFLSGLPNTPGVGNALTDEQMKESTNYTNWDFSTIWQIDPSKNNGFPTLRENLPTQVRRKR